MKKKKNFYSKWKYLFEKWIQEKGWNKRISRIYFHKLLVVCVPMSPILHFKKVKRAIKICFDRHAHIPLLDGKNESEKSNHFHFTLFSLVKNACPLKNMFFSITHMNTCIFIMYGIEFFSGRTDCSLLHLSFLCFDESRCCFFSKLFQWFFYAFAPDLWLNDQIYGKFYFSFFSVYRFRSTVERDRERKKIEYSTTTNKTINFFLSLPLLIWYL